VIVGVAVGLQLDALSSPAVGDHEQDVPPEPVSGVEVPAHTVFVPDAEAVGRPFTVSVPGGDVSCWPNPSVTTTA